MEPVSTKEKFSLTGRIAIITGGAGLLGSKHAQAIAEFGGITILLDIDEVKGKKVAASIKEKYNTNSIFLKADITSENEVTDTLKKVISKFKKVDILINGAGINAPTKFLQIREKDWSKVINSHLTTTLNGCQIFGEEMLKKRLGL